MLYVFELRPAGIWTLIQVDAGMSLYSNIVAYQICS
jgi:hypothetical protein